jgi:hypothetical protein
MENSGRPYNLPQAVGGVGKICRVVLTSMNLFPAKWGHNPFSESATSQALTKVKRGSLQ